MIGTQTLAQQAHPKALTAPLTGHPHFAPALTLWFAALFSLSTLAIRGALLESWVMAARVDMLLPAATPPLGLKARLLLAVVFALLGAAIGWLAARALRPAPVTDGDDFQLRQRDRHPDAPARRPISAHAELGDEGLGRVDAAYEQPVEDMPSFRPAVSDPFHASSPLDHVPAQPQEAGPYHVAPFAMPSFAEQPAANPVFTAPLQAEPVVSDQAAPPPAPARETEAQADPYDLPTIDFMMEEAPRGLHIAPYPAPAAETDEQPHKAPRILEDAVEDEGASGDDMWHTLPPVVSETDMPSSWTSRGLSAVPRLRSRPSHLPTPLRAVVSQTPAQTTAQPATRPELHLAVVSPQPVTIRPVTTEPEQAPAMIGATPVQPRANTGERIAHAPLGDLSHVELIERLAMAIHTREKGAQGDAQDVPDTDDDEEEMTGTQASLRSALASLREVK
jgi:hypothetical protein